MQHKSRTGRPLKELELTDEEREKLELIARRPKTSQRMALRARIILLSASGNPTRPCASSSGAACLRWANGESDSGPSTGGARG